MRLTFEQWILYFKGVSVFLLLLGVFWAISGSFDPLGIWDGQFAKAFYNQELLSNGVARAKAFILVPLGATNAAYFMLQYFIVDNALRRKEKWAYNAILIGFVFWFVLDSAMSFYHGAAFNVLLANLPCLVLMSPLFFLRKGFTA